VKSIETPSEHTPANAGAADEFKKIEWKIPLPDDNRILFRVSRRAERHALAPVDFWQRNGKSRPALLSTAGANGLGARRACHLG